MIRIGHGYDVHRLVPDRKLILGGVEIAHETGLLGHSDADVLTHAVMDALLGAAAMGDIGKLFPDTDPAFAGADSLLLAKEVVRRITAAGYRVGNVDATVIAQAPKLAPHIDAMRQNLAAVMNVDLSCVNVKATTEEKLGFTGEKRGLSVGDSLTSETNISVPISAPDHSTGGVSSSAHPARSTISDPPPCANLL